MIAERAIGENLEDVRVRIDEAARRAGRQAGDVRLVAVSKGQPAEAVRAAYALGQRDFGENRVEDAIEKISQLVDLADIRWHLIGHLQSRKVALVGSSFELIHSVDRLKIARRLSGLKSGRRQPILLEGNVSGEASKEGWQLSDRSAWGAIDPDIAEILRLEGLQARGVMTIAPISSDERLVRSVFRRLREWRDHLQEGFPGQWGELSMGMTDDFVWAVEEGATIVRIGRAIFGPRPDA